LARTVTVREENAAAAVELMSRFASDPRWLVYLPPTMAPTATSQRPDLLEHPEDAFAEYRAGGITQVICEEKHMGSRAVVIVCRDAAIAADRFGVDSGETGAIYTRTGRPFLNSLVETEDALSQIRAAVDSAGIWRSLDSGWLVLDCELLPWSAKAMDLIRRQYASVGAAAHAGLNASVAILEQAAGRGLDVAGLIENERARGEDVDRYIDAYRRYVGTVNSVADLRLAPFHVLAAETGVFVDRDHVWHLDLCDQLVAANGEWLIPTQRLEVDLTDEKSQSAAIAWWEQLTASGGEGMVVKPTSFTADSAAAALPGSDHSLSASSHSASRDSNDLSPASLCTGCMNAHLACSRWRANQSTRDSEFESQRRAARTYVPEGDHVLGTCSMFRFNVRCPEVRRRRAYAGIRRATVGARQSEAGS
jgi:protein phosphatase